MASRAPGKIKSKNQAGFVPTPAHNGWLCYFLAHGLKTTKTPRGRRTG